MNAFGNQTLAAISRRSNGKVASEVNNTCEVVIPEGFDSAEEWESYQQEWIEYVPELLEAIECGALDEHLRAVARACFDRRYVIDPEAKKAAKAAALHKSSASSAPQPSVIDPVWTRGVEYQSYRTIADSQGRVYTNTQLRGKTFVVPSAKNVPAKYRGRMGRVLKVNQAKLKTELFMGGDGSTNIILNVPHDMALDWLRQNGSIT